MNAITAFAAFALVISIPAYAKRAIARDPRDISAEQKLKDGDRKGAIEDLRSLAGDRPYDFYLCQRLAGIVLEEEGVAPAIGQWDIFLRNRTSFHDVALMARGDLKVLKPDLKGAIEDYAAAAAVARAPYGVHADITGARLWALRVVAGDIEAADKDLKAFLDARPALDPCPATTWIDIAAGRADAAKADEAVSAWTAKGHPDLPSAEHFYLGLRALHDGKKPDARAEFKKCLELSEKESDESRKTFEVRAAGVALEGMKVE